MLCTPNRSAVSGLASTSSLATRTRPAARPERVGGARPGACPPARTTTAGKPAPSRHSIDFFVLTQTSKYRPAPTAPEDPRLDGHRRVTLERLAVDPVDPERPALVPSDQASVVQQRQVV